MEFVIFCLKLRGSYIPKNSYPGVAGNVTRLLVFPALLSVVREDPWWFMERPHVLFSLLTMEAQYYPLVLPLTECLAYSKVTQLTLAIMIYILHGPPNVFTVPCVGLKLSPRCKRLCLLCYPAEPSDLENLPSFSLSERAYSRAMKLGVSDSWYMQGPQFLCKLKHHLIWELEMNSKEMSFQTQFSKQAPNNTQQPPFAFCWMPDSISLETS